jgi:hypothetical protein
MVAKYRRAGITLRIELKHLFDHAPRGMRFWRETEKTHG